MVAVRSVYQPIVDLATGEPIGYEALARGPRGSALERPDALFAAARDAGRLAELEQACRVAAVRGAREARLSPDLGLFVNVEPSTITTPMPDTGGLRVVLELTERALTERPADVIAAIPRLREQGFAIALDDVGADPRSIALMPFISPDVIKLDLRLVQDRPSPEIASVVHAVSAEAERSGALLLAEGIETAEQELTARALGARFGQGWRYGRPADLPPAAAAERPAGPGVVASRRPEAVPAATPFELVSAHHTPRPGTKRLLHAISRRLEAQLPARGESAVLLACFQEARHLTPATAALYERLARGAAFVGALGAGLEPEPVPGVRGADLHGGEPLRGEWNVIVVDPHFAAAFCARDLGDTGCDDMDRRFDFCLTYDRRLVVEAARSLMTRIAPAAQPESTDRCRSAERSTFARAPSSITAHQNAP